MPRKRPPTHIRRMRAEELAANIFSARATGSNAVPLGVDRDLSLRCAPQGSRGRSRGAVMPAHVSSRRGDRETAHTSHVSHTSQVPPRRTAPSAPQEHIIQDPIPKFDVLDVGPHPGFIRACQPFVFEWQIQQAVKTLGTEGKDDQWRIQGIAFMNEIRQVLKLPAKVFNSAATIFHRFRLEHSLEVYHLTEVVPAALYLASKIESTAKRPNQIVCAAYNLTAAESQKLLPEDDVFDAAADKVVDLEPKLLEAISFEFQAMHANDLALQIVKVEFGYQYSNPEHKMIFDTVWAVSLDLNFTYSLIKNERQPLALACVEVVFRLMNRSDVFDSKFSAAPPETRPHIPKIVVPKNPEDFTYDPPSDPEILDPTNPYARFFTTRKNVMEVIMDVLDLYTIHRTQTIAGRRFTNEQIMAVKIQFNKIAEAYHVPRYAVWNDDPNRWVNQEYLYDMKKPEKDTKSRDTNGRPNSSGQTNGHAEDTAESKNEPEQKQVIAVKRFILRPEDAVEETSVMNDFFLTKQEEYQKEHDEEDGWETATDDEDTKKGHRGSKR